MKIIATSITAAAAVMALAGCKASVSVGSTSSDEISASKVASTIAQAYAKQKSVDASTVEVSCADALPAKTDAEVKCDMTAEDTVYAVTATYTGKSGSELHAEWTPTGLSKDAIERSVSAEATKKGLTVASLTCTDDLLAAAGSTISCSMNANDRAWDVTVTSTGMKPDGTTVGYHWDAKSAAPGSK
ncbi:hypothetical protein GCM10027076_29750 [Nocardioides montaniterrae]